MPQGDIADRVTVVVIDLLEMIHVDNRGIQLHAIASANLLDLHKLTFYPRAQAQPGQGVVAGGIDQKQGLELRHQLNQFTLRLLKAFHIAA